MVLSKCQNDALGKNMSIGSHHYRAFVGPPENYDLISAMQFNLLTTLGLREHHFLLDIGCGSLRGGKLFIPYLLPDHYFGIEPEQWLIEEGFRKELGRDIIAIKKPVFSNDRDFTCTIFDQKFDFILAQSIFSHASQAQIRRCLSQAKECMKTTSIFAASFYKGILNYSGDEWVYPDLVSYTLIRLRELANEQGLVCEQINWPHPGNLTWAIFFFPENSEIFLDDYQRWPARLPNRPFVEFGLGVKRFLSRTWSFFIR